MQTLTNKFQRVKRHYRIRNKISGTEQVPRMSVYISGKHIYIQFIDDVTGRTLASSSTLASNFRESNVTANLSGAEKVGRDAADKALKAGVKRVKFDRGGFKFHGRIKRIAEVAREIGLEF